jgi:hypothetical protein
MVSERKWTNLSEFDIRCGSSEGQTSSELRSCGERDARHTCIEMNGVRLLVIA